MATASSTPYTVSGIHPETGKFHGESCATLEEAQRRAKELQAAGYRSVTIAPSDSKAPSWPRNWRRHTLAADAARARLSWQSGGRATNDHSQSSVAGSRRGPCAACAFTATCREPRMDICFGPDGSSRRFSNHCGTSKLGHYPRAKCITTPRRLTEGLAASSYRAIRSHSFESFSKSWRMFPLEAVSARW